jgi:hypothetical protein
MSAHSEHRGRRSAVPRGERVAQLVASVTADAGARLSVSDAPPLDPPLPPSVLQWFTQLTLLYGVPFPYLVADAALLPPESVRFFYVDQNWLDRAIDGALSVATMSTADDVFNEALFDAVYAANAGSQQAMRSKLRQKTPPETTIAGGTYTGLLFRSIVVSGWPGLEVYATKDGAPVEILRMDRLSPTVLLVLFSDVPTEVVFHEPSEQLHFGMLVKGSAFEATLRGLGFGGFPAGVQITDPNDHTKKLTVPVTTRTGTYAGVVDVATLVSAITSTMPAGALPAALTSGEFAIQMVQSAGKQRFTIEQGSRDCTVRPGGSGT